MANADDVKKYIRHSEITKTLKTKLWGKLTVLLAVGLLAVMLLPRIDKAMTGGDKPGVISFIGTGLVISLITFYLFTVSLRESFYGNKTVLYYALFYNILIVVTKFVLAPISLYKKDPTIVVDNGSFSISQWANFNGNIFAIGILVAGVLLLYLIFFTFLKKLTIRSINKRFSLKSASLRKRISFGLILAVIAVAIFTGGIFVFIPLVLSGLVLNNSALYLSFIFTTTYSVIIALMLTAAVACAGMMFVETERHTVANRNLNLMITVIWVGIGLLLVYHIIWAVYLFVLTTLWPFKVVTVTSK